MLCLSGCHSLPNDCEGLTKLMQDDVRGALAGDPGAQSDAKAKEVAEIQQKMIDLKCGIPQ
ncbi:MAG TPA: hypothetical protein VG944_24885 [Fimbriimonas sp.]|nr:hypothetical protein [Fimbriimonas sp.]